MVNNRIYCLLIPYLCGLVINTAQASLNVELPEPAWEFLLEYKLAVNSEVRPESYERSFVQKIKPLLAQQKYTEVIKAFQRRPLAEDSAALQLLRGQVLMSLKQTVKAERALIAAATTAPHLVLAHRSLSVAYMLQKKYLKARQHLVRTIELGGADAQVYGQLAFINVQTASPASAVAGYEQAMFMEPNNKQWQQGLLYALMNSKAHNQAQALVEEQLEGAPNNAELWLLRSQIALQQQRYKQALSSLEIAIRLGESSPANQTTAAQLHLQHGSTRRAVDLLNNNITQLNRRNSDTILNTVDQVAAWLAHQQQWTALSSLLKTLASVKRKVPAHYQARFNVYRAQQALAKGQTTRAKKWLMGAIKIDPTQGEALLALADLLRGQQRLDQALMYYVRAEAMPAHKEQALLGRAQLGIDRKAYREALRILRRVVRGNPSRSDIAANIQSLENLVRNQG